MFQPKRHRIAITTLALLCLTGPNSSYAYWNPSLPEVMKLPPYCKAQFRPEIFKGPEYAFPPCGGWFNHYCPGLAALNQASNPALSPSERRFMLSEARGHIRYTVHNLDKAPPNCPLKPMLDLAQQRIRMLDASLK